MAEQMKPSGIDWIGDIPKSWKVKPIAYMTKSRSGGTPDRNNLLYWENGTIPWMSSGEVNKVNIYDTDEKITTLAVHHSSAKIISKNAVMVALNGQGKTKGMSAILRIDSACNQSLCAFSCNAGILYYEYLFWCFQTMYTYLRQMSGDDVRDGLAASYVKKQKIPVPKYEEQQAIADFLDKECAQIDSIAADLEKQIELLQQYKKSLITETVTKGLDKTVPMKDSGVEWLGKIPAHWNFKRLKFMLENSSDSMKVGPFGSALSGSYFTDEGKWVYNQRVVLDNNFSENTTFVSEEKFQEMRSFAVCPGDILITTRGTIGKVAIVPEGANEGILHPCIIKFRVDKEMIIPELLQLIFNESDFVKDQFTLMSNATTIEVIYSYSLKDILLPVIPADEQKKIYGYLSKKCLAIDGIIAEKQKSLATITQHKKSLIYEYVTGKKRVKEVR